jgi:hypothetical protein
VVQRFGYSFAAESVECPEDDHIESALMGILEKLFELRLVGLAAQLGIKVFFIDCLRSGFSLSWSLSQVLT